MDSISAALAASSRANASIRWRNRTVPNARRTSAASAARSMAASQAAASTPAAATAARARRAAGHSMGWVNATARVVRESASASRPSAHPAANSSSGLA